MYSCPAVLKGAFGVGYLLEAGRDVFYAGRDVWEMLIDNVIDHAETVTFAKIHSFRRGCEVLGKARRHNGHLWLVPRECWRCDGFNNRDEIPICGMS